jgi:outer membrane protein assembly factor BamA
LLDWFGRAPRTGLALLALFGLLMPAAMGAPTPSPAAAPTPVPATAPAPPTANAPRVVDVSVTGNTHVPSDKILAVVKTKVGEPFDPQLVTGDLRAINDLGFFADQAPPEIKQRPDGVSVTFRVVENPVVTSIRFQGNRTVSVDTLTALMDTSTGNVFNLKTYQEDVLKINSYYDKIGYGGQVPSHVTDVNIDTAGVLTLTIQEGLTVRHQRGQLVLRIAARQGRRETQRSLQTVRSHDRRFRSRHRSGDRRHEGRHGRRALRDFGRARRCDRDHR